MSSSSGLTFKLHPLVILNISDHHTRVKSQSQPPQISSSHASSNGGGDSAPASSSSAPSPPPRVFGCVIGVQRGRTVEIFNSFELLYDPLMDINESPVYVLLNPSINHSQKDLPVNIYESELHIIDGIPQLIFVHASYTIETVEAERISVDHVAHLKPSDGGSAATQLAAHLTGIHSAIKMLNSRIRWLLEHLITMQKGETPCENSLLRQVSSLLRRLPAVESQKFQDDFLMEFNDTLLVTYLAMLTNCSRTTYDLVDKFNTAYDRHTRRGGRTAFI
ncbi:OLC1v1022336C1 [Oldenlandia corymbosa var. corymbosa]|uniref:COP9 signalosome complex subunit 6 n=1 Tax=Oldenlandia corymbosa var. corymbosa TaxID=529605 RepID=A0AAV1C1C8_OLDCO|nr:OLC1v1022336C1 [Oldenlandia corymbosa var. corymbosa]